jgi:hypothetical protein
MQRITQNAQTSSVPCQLTYFEVRREMLGGNMATPTIEPVRLPPGPRAPKIVQGVTFLTARQPVRSPRSSASGARTCRWPRPGSAHSTPDRRVRGKTPRSTPRICAHATITGVVGQGNCRVDGIASLNRRHHGMLGVVWHQVRRILNAGRQRVRRCRFVKHDERRVIGSLDKWRHRRDDWS